MRGREEVLILRVRWVQSSRVVDRSSFDLMLIPAPEPATATRVPALDTGKKLIVILITE